MFAIASREGSIIENDRLFSLAKIESSFYIGETDREP